MIDIFKNCKLGFKRKLPWPKEGEAAIVISTINNSLKFIFSCNSNTFSEMFFWTIFTSRIAVLDQSAVRAKVIGASIYT